MNPSKLFTSNSFLGHLVNTLVTTIGVVVVALIGFKGTIGSTAPDQMAVLTSRVTALEERLDTKTAEIRNLNRELLTVRAENSIMRIQLDNGYASSPRGTLYAYMDAIESPSWCKEWKPEQSRFIMLHINRSYETYYGVTRARYEGASDFDLFPPEVAQVWFENDKIAYHRRGFGRFVEPAFTPSGDRIELEFWKFYLRLPDTGELVCGIQIGEVLGHGDITP